MTPSGFLAEALLIRGDAVLARFEAMQASDAADAPKLNPKRMDEIRRALQRAQDELLIEESTEAEAVAESGMAK